MNPLTISRVEQLGGFVIHGPGLQPSLAIHQLHADGGGGLAITLYGHEHSIHLLLTADQSEELMTKLAHLVEPTN